MDAEAFVHTDGLQPNTVEAANRKPESIPLSAENSADGITTTQNH